MYRVDNMEIKNITDSLVEKTMRSLAKSVYGIQRRKHLQSSYAIPYV